MSKEMCFPAESRATPGPVTDGLLGFVGAIAGLGAIGASSCCVLPLALASVGAGSGVFSFLEFLAPYRTPMLLIGGLTVASGWFVWWRKKAACEPGSACVTRPRSRPTMAMLTVLAVLYRLV